MRIVVITARRNIFFFFSAPLLRQFNGCIGKIQCKARRQQSASPLMKFSCAQRAAASRVGFSSIRAALERKNFRRWKVLKDRGLVNHFCNKFCAVNKSECLHLRARCSVGLPARIPNNAAGRLYASMGSTNSTLQHALQNDSWSPTITANDPIRRHTRWW